MVRIAVVEYSMTDWTILSEHRERYKKTTPERFSLSRFPNGIGFISDYKADFDIILMDIDMPHLNGLDTARRLRQVGENVAQIFITNLTQYAINGYEVRAMDFMVKPVEYGELEYKLNRALPHCRKRGNDILTLESAGVARKVPLRTIYYVEVYNHSLIYHTTAGCGWVIGLPLAFWPCWCWHTSCFASALSYRPRKVCFMSVQPIPSSISSTAFPARPSAPSSWIPIPPSGCGRPPPS